MNTTSRRITQILSVLFLSGMVAASAGAFDFRIRGTGAACGSAAGRYIKTISRAGLCVNSRVRDISGSGPWSWRCVNRRNGASVKCSSVASQSMLSISSDCHLMKDGHRFRAIGVNYYSPFADLLTHPDKAAAYRKAWRNDFRSLHAAGVPFIRFTLLPFWPTDARPYIDHPQTLLPYLDQFVSDAKTFHIGLVPSVFFNYLLLPDYFGEPISAWGNPASRTRQFANLLTRMLGHHYAGNTSIWMWEFSNETNDWDDFPNAWKYFRTNPREGTPSSRLPRDDYSSRQLISAFKAFSNAIHQTDPGALVDSGFDIPRNNALHLAMGSVTRDDVADFQQVLARDNGPGDLISIHVYPVDFNKPYSKRFSDQPVGPAEFIPIAANAARRACKPLFIGEFGAPDDGSDGDSNQSLKDFHIILDAIVHSSTSLAAAWVFDFPFQDGKNGNYSITPDNSHRDRLRLITKANARLREDGSGLADSP